MCKRPERPYFSLLFHFMCHFANSHQEYDPFSLEYMFVSPLYARIANIAVALHWFLVEN